MKHLLIADTRRLEDGTWKAESWGHYLYDRDKEEAKKHPDAVAWGETEEEACLILLEAIQQKLPAMI